VISVAGRSAPLHAQNHTPARFVSEAGVAVPATRRSGAVPIARGEPRRKFFAAQSLEEVSYRCMHRRDWLILTLNAAGRSGLLPAQLQKSLFLLDRELPNSFDQNSKYRFVAHNYGPFCKQIYDDAEELARDGLATITQAFGSNYPEYTITSRGQTVAAQIRQHAHPASLAYLESVVNWVKQRTFSELVRAIYRKYPEFRANSVFQD